MGVERKGDLNLIYKFFKKYADNKGIISTL